MVTTKFGRFTVGFLFIAALLVLPTVAAAQKSSTFVIPFDRSGTPEFDDPLNALRQTGGAFINPCTGDFVDVFGDSTITVNQSLFANGDFRTVASVVTKGSGTGWFEDLTDGATVSGNTYTFRDSQQFTSRQPAAGGQAFESTFTDRFVLRGARSIDNWVIRAHFRIKISSTGAVLVLVDRLSDLGVCRG